MMLCVVFVPLLYAVTTALACVVTDEFSSCYDVRSDMHQNLKVTFFWDVFSVSYLCIRSTLPHVPRSATWRLCSRNLTCSRSITQVRSYVSVFHVSSFQKSGVWRQTACLTLNQLNDICIGAQRSSWNSSSNRNVEECISKTITNNDMGSTLCTLSLKIWGDVCVPQRPKQQYRVTSSASLFPSVWTNREM